MARRKRKLHRPARSEPKYNDSLIGLLVNTVMECGKKAVAQDIVYQAFEMLSERANGGDPQELFHRALGNIQPLVEVRSRRVGGATYQVPTEVPAGRGQSLGVRWLVQAARSRGERTAAERVANELIDALNNRGASVKRREETHKMAEANKAFAHFRW